MTPAWYLHRLRSMGVREVAWRVRNAAIQRLWRRRRGERWPVPVAHPRWAGGRVPEKAARDAVGAEKVLASARGLLDNGQWPIFATVADLSGRHPDWFRDPATHVRGPADAYCFAIPFRDQARVGNIKHLWEVSRLHHLTVLAAAYHLSGDRRFADRALDHLRSWIQANPPLQGVHWVSGIEIGLRLLAWVWTRRLLDGVPGVEASFENDPLFRRQLHAHQAWIATFHSRGTSANNHLIAEMAGLLAASRAFPVFAESGRWSRNAAACLEREVWRQNFPDGVNREMAGDYHVFVAELFLVAGIEADASGPSLGERYWTGVSRMLNALAATVDVRGNGARQGDGDDARALLLDVPGTGTGTVLEVGATILGRPSWWPAPSARNVGAALLSSMAADHRAAASAPETRPSFFPEAASRYCATWPQVRMRSGAGSTTAHTGFWQRPRMPTPMHCRSNCVSADRRSWSIPGRIAIMARRSGGTTSVRPLPTTRSNSGARAKPSMLVRFSGEPGPTPNFLQSPGSPTGLPHPSRRATMDTWAPHPGRSTVGGWCWTVRRGASPYATGSKDPWRPTRASRSIYTRPSNAGWRGRVQSSPGLRLGRARPSSRWRRTCYGPSIAAKPIRSSGGTLRISAVRRPP